jgi:hypothetical protein
MLISVWITTEKMPDEGHENDKIEQDVKRPWTKCDQWKKLGQKIRISVRFSVKRKSY